MAPKKQPRKTKRFVPLKNRSKIRIVMIALSILVFVLGIIVGLNPILYFGIGLLIGASMTVAKLDQKTQKIRFDLSFALLTAAIVGALSIAFGMLYIHYDDELSNSGLGAIVTFLKAAAAPSIPLAIVAVVCAIIGAAIAGNLLRISPPKNQTG